METRDIALLATCSIFSHTELGRLANLLRTARYQEHRFPRDSLILMQGCIYTNLYILAAGTAFAEMSDDEGRTLRVESFSPVEALATAILFSDRPMLPVSVGAQTECRIFAFPKKEIIRLAMAEASIMEALLADAGNRLSFLTERLRLSRFASLRQRIAHWLLRALSEQRSLSPAAEEKTLQHAVRVVPSYEKLADLMGVARPSLSRELARMRAEGILATRGRTIVILNLEQLRALRRGEEEPSD